MHATTSSNWPWPATTTRAPTVPCRLGRWRHELEYGSAHFLLLPYIEQDNLFQQANGISFNVRTGPGEDVRLPDDPTVSDGLFTVEAVNYPFNGTSVGRTSVSGVPYGATTYAINAQVVEPLD